MPKITITIEASDDFSPSDLSSYVQTLREQFEEDAAETGYPAWTINDDPLLSLQVAALQAKSSS